MKETFKETLEPKALIFTEDPATIRCWACAHCGIVYSENAKDIAKNCCKKWFCQDCGKETHQHWTRCSPCSDKFRLANAELLTEYDGPVYDPFRDRYFGDMDEATEWYDDQDETEERPEFVFCCDERIAKDDLRFKMSDWIVDHVDDNYHEDASDHLIGLQELDEFCRAWAAKQTLVSWFPDCKRKVRVPPCQTNEAVS